MGPLRPVQAWDTCMQQYDLFSQWVIYPSHLLQQFHDSSKNLFLNSQEWKKMGLAVQEGKFDIACTTDESLLSKLSRFITPTFI